MKKYLLALMLACWAGQATAAFDVVALGVNGGVEEGNLTSYLIKSDDQKLYLGLDAGSVLPGIRQALAKGSFPEVTGENAAPLTPQGAVFRNLIGGYFISHGHLDHLAGLIISSPEDSKKPIYGTADTIGTLRQHYFNGRVWPNFTDSGSGFRIGTYRLNQQRPAQRFSLGLTGLDGTLYPLSHGGTSSSMILISRNNASFAFFGDTGPDEVEKSKNLDTVWRVLGDEIKAKRLKGIIIETSYPDGVPDSKLFGHLTPDWLLKELTHLQNSAGGEGSLKDLTVIISHVKPTLQAGADPEKAIMAQLEKGNNLGVKFVRMQQGERLKF
ncbi:3',5'-cyclic-nucleotide phosphodiesterase [Rahnella sp. BIGb0236]|uniref:MBL fold metallo-hydrolase n=1 Tax=Rahnella sp. BIGb0236 TaxID=2485117 RepID=UPI0010609B24|nr:MBL fold metallo-hydrolase [Rahnella sp. BIGb0236]TDS96834.1 3',5'-cyclic-nucleotide phosphodiesterase [Rahnella sp. BIGb0236]